jgi:(hydroxyamino)benzene mutase
MESSNRHLMWHGMFLFLLGLLTGLAEQHFTNVRMGLAAHLEGVMNGTFLVALGAIWAEVRLPSQAKATAYWTALYGTYVNWLSTTLAGVFGTAANTPIAAAGYSGQPWQETLVTAGFLTTGLSIIAASVLVLWGLRERASQSWRRRRKLIDVWKTLTRSASSPASSPKQGKSRCNRADRGELDGPKLWRTLP